MRYLLAALIPVAVILALYAFAVSRLFTSINSAFGSM